MSSILFNIVADMLAIIINREKIEGQIDGVVPHLIDKLMMRLFLWTIT
jgi:hypothetical protein